MRLISFSILLSILFMANGAKSETPQSLSGKHFVLVHGACHGAWSWYKIVPRLRTSGHNVTALDMAASGIDPRQANDLQSISDYVQPLRDFMESLPPREKVILVGHSYGGYAISQAMEYFPSKVAVAVFLAAAMPGPNLNVSAINQELPQETSEPDIDNRYEYGNGPNNPPTAITFGPLQLARRLYQLSPVEDWTSATTLVRKLRLFPAEDMTRELRLSTQNYGSVNRVYIITEFDKILKGLQLWMIKKNPPTEVEIISSDHMAMMSQPKELCTRLLVIANKYT